MSELTHAELPWSHSVEHESIESAAGYTVAYIVPHANINTVARTGQTHSHADAELICRAVNSHDELLAACKARVADWDSCTAPGAAAEGCPDPHDVALARAAIAKAAGERA